jgi:hypothetical protein
MATNTFDDELSSLLEEERTFMEESGYNRLDRLKLKKGDTVRARFLPVEMGTKKTWYMRIARYWIGGKPYLAPRQTSIHAGGDPTAPDPIGDLLEKIMKTKSTAIKSVVEKCRAEPQWLTYCLVSEMDSNGQKHEFTGKRLLRPYEHMMYRASFGELIKIYERTREKRKVSLVDLEEGAWIWMDRPNKGSTKFQRDELEPFISGLSATEFRAACDQVLAQVPELKLEWPSDEKIEEACVKLESMASGRRSETVDDEDAPRQRRAAPESRRPASIVDEEGLDTDTDDDDVVYEDPADKSEENPPAPRARPVRDVDTPTRAPDPDADGDAPPPLRRSTITQPPALRRQAASIHEREDVDEELPPERKDPAPPIRETAAPAAAKFQGGLRSAVAKTFGKIDEA